MISKNPYNLIIHPSEAIENFLSHEFNWENPKTIKYYREWVDYKCNCGTLLVQRNPVDKGYYLHRSKHSCAEIMMRQVLQ